MMLCAALATAITVASISPADVVAVAAPTPPPNGTPLLSLGDAAPALSVAKWLRGDQIDELVPGTVYVLDFSAPWCAPCVAALPHLSALRERFAAQRVRVIAVLGPDSAGTSAVAGLLEAARQPLQLSVAFDAHGGRPEPALDTFFGKTTAAYLEGAQLDGIPAAFVVDRQGRIVWIGAPAQVGTVLEQVVAGNLGCAECA